MRHRCLRGSTVGTRHRRTFRHRSLQIVLFTFLDDPSMETAIEQRFYLRIHVRFKRLFEELIQVGTLGFRQSMTRLMKESATQIQASPFAADERGPLQSKRAGCRPSSCRMRRTRSPRHSRALRFVQQDWRYRNFSPAARSSFLPCRMPVLRRVKNGTLRTGSHHGPRSGE